MLMGFLLFAIQGFAAIPGLAESQARTRRPTRRVPLRSVPCSPPISSWRPSGAAGLGALFQDPFGGRALAHAMLHGVTVWVLYMAIEPYVRRVWPRMLVSWTRLLSGRLRDPLLGRDVLIGLLVGCGMWAAYQYALVMEQMGRDRFRRRVADGRRPATSISRRASAACCSA